jgi:hypothetical protein
VSALTVILVDILLVTRIFKFNLLIYTKCKKVVGHFNNNLKIRKKAQSSFQVNMVHNFNSPTNVYTKQKLQHWNKKY